MLRPYLGIRMAVSQNDIDALNKAIASGERQVSIGGQSITYQTIDSLIKARDNLKGELARETLAAAGTPRPRQTTMVYGGRGFQA